MKTRKSLNKFFTKREKEVKDFLGQDPDQQSKDDIHHLRTNVKKIKALLSLAKLVGKKEDLKKDREPIDKWFSAAGKVRDLQVKAAKIFEENPKSSLSKYAGFLSSEIREEKRKFTRAQQSLKNKIKGSLKKLNTEVNKVRKKDVKKFEKKIGKKKRTVLKVKNPEPSDLHQLRKQVKKEQYVKEALKHKDKSKATDRSKKISELLGEWHDARVMADEIRHDLEKLKLPEKESIRLKEFAQQQKRQAHTLEQQIRKGKRIKT